MSSSCSAITSAMTAQGLNKATLASKAGLSEARVAEILANNVKPSTQEFNAIAGALNLSNAPKHAAEVTAR